ncbi:MAG TPA: sigma-70 family RNA polymerase sigma factor [Planctomycetaceae bacterium]|nr:sigma-70 family RNA polymerase sigma factor [Planctomycetaceae bacterium]
MSELESTVRLVARWRDGEEAAASDIVGRFRVPLTAIVAKLIGRRLRRRVDADDALQSAFHTFLRGARDGQFTVSQTGQLWGLLVSIARHKVQKQAELHTAARRDVASESEAATALAAHPDDTPSPDCEAALLDEIRLVLASHSERDATMLQMCLAGYSVSEIADSLACSRWTVRRVLDRIGEDLKRRLYGDG